MKIIALAALLLFSTSASAIEPFEINMPMMCGDTKNLVDGLNDNYGEEIVFMAPSKNSNGDNMFHSLWINYDTKTWTFIVVNREKGITCVMASGDGLKMFFPGAST